MARIAKKKIKKEVQKDSEKEEKTDFSAKKNQNQQLKWVIGIMVILLAAALIAYLIADSTRTFRYGGIHFEKIKFDKLQLYHAKVGLNSGANQVLYNLYLRNDPRDLEYISVNGTIILDKVVDISLDKGAERGCEDSGLAGASLGNLLKAGGLDIAYGFTDKDYAVEKNVSYITCEDSMKKSVIIVRHGNENKIIAEKDYCYVIQFKDCDILKTTERFIVATIAHAKGEEI